MVKRGAFKFFRSVLARKIVDPPLSESDATPSLISVGPSVDSGEWWLVGRDRAGRAAESTGTGHQPRITMIICPFLKCRFVLKMTFVSNLFSKKQ